MQSSGSFEGRLRPLVKVNSVDLLATRSPSRESGFYPQNLWISLWIQRFCLPQREVNKAILLHWLLFDHLILASKYRDVRNITDYWNHSARLAWLESGVNRFLCTK